MKTSLWMIIALVSGIVGFLTGYSVSSYTGTRSVAETPAAHDAPQAAAPAAVGPAATAAPAAAPVQKEDAAGYGAAPERPREAAPAPRAAAPASSPAAASKPAAAAAGY
jgi:hypothetical protein